MPARKQKDKTEEAPPTAAYLELMPVWLKLGPRWYKRLYFVSQKCALSAADTLTRGIELVLREHEERDKAARRTAKLQERAARRQEREEQKATRRKSAPPEVNSKAGAAMAKAFWAGKSEQERSRIMRERALKRWHPDQKSE